jgi:septum formation protein
VADVDEESVDLSDPVANVIETARLKANAVAALRFDAVDAERAIVVAGDTTVALDGKMLGKPRDEADAVQMLRALRDRIHQVHTGLVLVDLGDGREISAAHTASVGMRNYSEPEISAYVATGDPMDKAGAYAIQHPLFRPVSYLDGCYTGVMGLSLCHLIENLRLLQVPDMVAMRVIQESHGPHPCHLFNDLVSAERS